MNAWGMLAWRRRACFFTCHVIWRMHEQYVVLLYRIMQSFVIFLLLRMVGWRGVVSIARLSTRRVVNLMLCGDV